MNRILSSFGLIASALFVGLFLIPLKLLASDIVGSWSSTTSLPSSIASHTSFAHNGKIYVIGGANTTVVPLSIFSTVQPDGLLSEWISSSVPSPPVFWHATALKDNFVYILGGVTYPPLVNTSNVFMGIIEESGNIGSWQTLTHPLPQSLALGAAVVIGNRLYFAGGSTSGQEVSGAKQKVYKADINLDGTIGDWTEAGLLPDSMIGFGMVEINNHIVIIGGRGLSSGSFANVRSAEINPDGTLGSWTELPPLPYPVLRASITRAGNTLISAGGIYGSSYLNLVFSAHINPDGSISEWSTSPNNLPRVNCCSPLVAWGNKVYLTGGHNGLPGGYFIF